MSQSAITVVIPAYNASKFIGETLASVFAQTYPNFSVTVVDDGSKDDLESAVAPWRDRLQLVRQENAGTSVAKNRGIMDAQTEYVATIDSDDLWEPTCLEEQMALLQSGYDIVYPNNVIFGGGPHVGKLFMDLCPSNGEVTFLKLVTQEANVNTSVLARKSALVKAGLFDPDFRGSEDFDLWLRAAHSGARIGYNRKPLMKYRVRPGSLSSDDIWMRENLVNVLHKIRRTLSLTLEETRVIDDTIKRHTGELELMRGKRAFYQGHFDEARRNLAAANDILQRPKLKLAALALRIAPRVLLYTAQARDRRLLRSS